MKEIEKCGKEIGLGLGSLGFFLMLGLWSTTQIPETDFQYCYSRSENYRNDCFEQLKQLKAYDK